MEIGVAFPASTTLTEHVKLAESLGYTHAWVDDSQMLFSDPYVSLTLLALATETIALGVGVTNPSTRIAAVTANAMATINRLAPGRMLLGIGTGNTALRVMGRRAARTAELRDYIDALHSLLSSEATVHGHGDPVDPSAHFVDPAGGWIDISTPLPVYVAGSGPRVLELAGETADGIILFGTIDSELIGTALARVRRGAERTGRNPGALPVMCMTAFCLLEPGESATSARTLQRIGPFVTTAANLLAVSNSDANVLPEHLRSDLLAFRDIFRQPSTKDESNYSGYATGVRADAAALMSEDIIRATTLTGTRNQIRQQLQAMEAAGVSMVSIRPVVDIEKTIRSFAESALG